MRAGVATSPHSSQARPPSPGSEAIAAWALDSEEAEASKVPNRFRVEASFAASPASHCPCPGGLPPKGAGPAEWFPKSRPASARAYAGAASPPPCLRFPGPFPFGNDAVPRRPVAGRSEGPFPARPLLGYGWKLSRMPIRANRNPPVDTEDIVHKFRAWSAGATSNPKLPGGKNSRLAASDSLEKPISLHRLSPCRTWET